MRIDPETHDLVVTLTPEDRLRAYAAGVARYRSHRERGRADGRFASKWDGPPYTPDIEGAMAEVAFWLGCGEEPPSDLVLTYAEWARARGENGGELLDVHGVEIRASCRRQGRIIVHRESERDHRKDNVPFVMALLTRSPVYPEMEFRTGDPDMDSMLGREPGDLQLYDREVRFTGWSYGREATSYFEGMRHPEWTVPAERVNRMEVVPPGVRWPDPYATCFEGL